MKTHHSRITLLLTVMAACHAHPAFPADFPTYTVEVTTTYAGKEPRTCRMRFAGDDATLPVPFPGFGSAIMRIDLHESKDGQRMVSCEVKAGIAVSDERLLSDRTVLFTTVPVTVNKAVQLFSSADGSVDLAIQAEEGKQ